MTPSLLDIAHCFGGIVPPALATVGPDGVPNVVRLSSARVLDARHVVLSRQFFGKTVANLDANPDAMLVVGDPATYRAYLLRVRFLRSEVSGALFDRLSAEIDAIASMMGMSEVFRLKGADVFEVVEIRVEPDVQADG